MRMLFIALCAAVAAPAAVAQLYICDNDGRRSYTSNPSGENCRLQKSYERGNQQPITAAPRPAATLNSKKVTPSSYPTVSATTQKIRDKKRGEILRYELERETKRRQLATQQIEEVKTRSPQDTYLISHLEDQLHIHTQNIIAIKQELSRL